MPDLSKDTKSEEISSKLDDYVTKHIASEILRKSENKSDLDFKRSVYAYDAASAAREDLLSSIDSYIGSFDNIEDKKRVAGSVLFRIVDKYKYKKGDILRKYFRDEGFKIASDIVEKYPLSDKVKSDFYAHVFKGKKMKKVSASVLNIILPKDYKNPLEDQDIDKIAPTAELLRNYTEYLCKYAYCCSNEDVSTDALYKLLKRNTSVQGLDVVHPTLFDEGGKKNAINKNMVLEVAKIYSTHISKEANLLMENNEKFDDNMTKMFGEIVTKHDYKPKEVEALKDVLISNSDDKEYTTTIANNVGMAYINSRKMLHNMRSR